MPETSRALRNAVSVTLDAAGAGTVSFGPSRHGVRWEITRVSVQTSTSALVPTAKVYRDSVGAATFITGTFVGSFDTDDGLSEVLNHGERLLVRWEGGDPGATATAVYFGTESAGMA